MRKDWIRTAGFLVVSAAAVWASFSTLASLAVFAGWGDRASWLLPASIDALGMTACRVWLSAGAPLSARRYARATTLTAAVLSIAGNGVGHLAATGHLTAGVTLVVLVGAVPPASLTAVVHLAVLVSAPVPTGRRSRTAAPVPAVPVPESGTGTGTTKPRAVPKKKTATKPVPKSVPVPAVPVPEAVPVPGTDPVPDVDQMLIHRARKLDEEYQTKHGRPIPRDKARIALGVRTETASEALRLAREGVA